MKEDKRKLRKSLVGGLGTEVHRIRSFRYIELFYHLQSYSFVPLDGKFSVWYLSTQAEELPLAFGIMQIYWRGIFSAWFI